MNWPLASEYSSDSNMLHLPPLTNDPTTVLTQHKEDHSLLSLTCSTCCVYFCLKQRTSLKNLHKQKVTVAEEMSNATDMKHKQKVFFTAQTSLP
jgi:hypothetical protein